LLDTQLAPRSVRTFHLDEVLPDVDLARALATRLQSSEGKVTHVVGWEDAFLGNEGLDRLYRFNLLRETIFQPKAPQIWWMSEEFRDTFMRHAPDTWSYMRLRLMVAELDEYIELPPALGRLVRNALGLLSDAPISRDAAEELKILDASFEKLTPQDIAALGTLLGLEYLDLTGTNLSDTSPIARLRKLQKLDLRHTPISDISALARLKGLKQLDLSGTKVSEISPLASLTDLHTLNLRHTQIRDLSPLAGLTALKLLDLSGNRIADLAPLAQLTDLRILDLSGT
jgi:Leucine-rich repeat (LRR) protein